MWDGHGENPPTPAVGKVLGAAGHGDRCWRLTPCHTKGQGDAGAGWAMAGLRRGLLGISHFPAVGQRRAGLCLPGLIYNSN